MRYTTVYEDVQFYIVFICGLSIDDSKRLIEEMNPSLLDKWAILGAAASDDGFEALSRWVKKPNIKNYPVIT